MFSKTVDYQKELQKKHNISLKYVDFRSIFDGLLTFSEDLHLTTNIGFETQTTILESGWWYKKEDATNMVSYKALQWISQAIEHDLDTNISKWIKTHYYTIIDIFGLSDTFMTRYFITSAFLHTGNLNKGQLLKISIFMDSDEYRTLPLIIHEGLTMIGESILTCAQNMSTFEALMKHSTPTSKTMNINISMRYADRYLAKKLDDYKFETYIMQIDHDKSITEARVKIVHGLIGAMSQLEHNGVDSKVIKILKLLES